MGNFGGHFGFFKFSDVRHRRRSKILTDLDSAPNLAIETTSFVLLFRKKSRFAQP